MRLWGSSNRSGSRHESSRTSRCKRVRLLRVESKKLKVHRILLYSFARLPRTCVVIPFTTVQERAALFRSHWTSSQDPDKSRRFSGFDRGHQGLPHWLPLSMDVGLYAVSIENSQPIEGGRDVNFNILALVQYLENVVRGAPDNIESSLMSIFRYHHPPLFTHFRQSIVSVHLQDHMHLASTFLGKHCTHRIEGTCCSLHVIIHGRWLMCMRSHSGNVQWKMGCSSFIYLERG